MLNDIEIIKIAITIISLMIAVIGHEIMHGYVAYRYGDTTAKDAGRLSINPIVHIDLIGTILIPGLLYISGVPFLFGWAKPVPIDVQKIVHNGGYKAGMAVALAGVGYNFALAIIASILLGFLETKEQSLIGMLFSIVLMYIIIYNVIIGFFNLWPLPPLDGSNALRFLVLQYGWQSIINIINKIEPIGIVLLIIILATPFSEWFFAPAHWLINILLN